jgi:hypothetical protein
MLISTLPRHFTSPEELGAWITNGLAEGLDYQNPTPETWRMLDKRILEETETLGWRIVTSTLVLMRLRAWESESEGIVRYRQFGEALLKFAHTMHQGKPPLDPRIYQNKQETVNELRVAFRVLREQFTASWEKNTSPELMQQFQQIIAEGDYPFLQANPDSWDEFFTAEASFIQNALNSRFSPATIYDTWLAWATRYEQETLRQKICDLKL